MLPAAVGGGLVKVVAGRVTTTNDQKTEVLSHALHVYEPLCRVEEEQRLSLQQYPQRRNHKMLKVPPRMRFLLPISRLDIPVLFRPIADQLSRLCQRIFFQPQHPLPLIRGNFLSYSTAPHSLGRGR